MGKRPLPPASADSQHHGGSDAQQVGSKKKTKKVKSAPQQPIASPQPVPAPRGDKGQARLKPGKPAAGAAGAAATAAKARWWMDGIASCALCASHLCSFIRMMGIWVPSIDQLIIDRSGDAPSMLQISPPIPSLHTHTHPQLQQKKAAAAAPTQAPAPAAATAEIDDLFASLSQKKKAKAAQEEQARRKEREKEKQRTAKEGKGKNGGGDGDGDGPAPVEMRYDPRRDDPDVRPCECWILSVCVGVRIWVGGCGMSDGWLQGECPRDRIGELNRKSTLTSLLSDPSTNQSNSNKTKTQGSATWRGCPSIAPRTCAWGRAATRRSAPSTATAASD